MDRLDVMKSAFQDELQKIAGSMQGHTRSGRKPIGIKKMLEKESEMPKASEILKMSGFPVKETALVLGGAGAYHQGRKVKRRYDIGKQVEQQNNGY
jgi:hypothetical protein